MTHKLSAALNCSLNVAVFACYKCHQKDVLIVKYGILGVMLSGKKLSYGHDFESGLNLAFSTCNFVGSVKVV